MSKDITNLKFGYLTVLSKQGVKGSNWICKCDCGNIKIVTYTNLTLGYVKSCGCYRKQQATQRMLTHGQCYTKLYKVWSGMIQRCGNPKSISFKNYGKKGIKVCDEWRDFTNFYKWSMENGYKDSLTIDRKDNTKNYEPSNCRWVDYKTQGNNRCNNHLITINNETKTLTEWCDIYSISKSTVLGRLYRGWNELEALTTLPNHIYASRRRRLDK